MAKTSLLSLPTDLLIRGILQRLSVRDILRFCVTCRRFSRFPSTDIYLAYHLELLIAGLVDNVRCTQDACPTANRLQILREREGRWNQVRVKWTKVYNTPRLSRWYADLSSSGSYSFGKLVTNENGSHLAGFYSTQLPSTRSRALPWSMHPVVDLEKLLGFAFSPEDQDLIVYATSTNQNGQELVKLYLLSYTTQQPHPQASSFVLTMFTGGLSTSEDWHHGKAPIAVWGDTLALVANHLVGDGTIKDVLHVWNWRTGIEIGATELSTSLSITGVVFLRQDLLLLPNQEKNRLEIFQIGSNPPYDSNTWNPHLRAVQPLLYLSLPEINAGAQLVIRNCQSSGITSPSQHHASPNRPFLNDVNTAIIVVHLQYYLSNFTSDKFMYSLFIDRPSIVAYATRTISTAAALVQPTAQQYGRQRGLTNPQTALPLRVDWEGWGYQATRWVKTTSENVLSVSGARYAHSGDNAEVSAWKDSIEVLDFAPLRVSRLARGPHSLTGRTQVYGWDQPTVLPASEGVFTKDVYSCLLYARHVYESSASDSRYLGDKQFWHQRAVCIDEERIVGLVITPDENAFQALDVLYFG